MNEPQLNQPVFIIGCQRSGTTLLNLMLDSHPNVHGVDEMHFNAGHMREYMFGSAYRPCVCFKLPTATHTVQELKTFPGVKILWALRDPRQVVASMLKLSLHLEDTPIHWIEHPIGGVREIDNCWALLADTDDEALQELVRQRDTYARDPERRHTREAHVHSAALCWRLKQAILPLYESQSIDIRVVRYENIVERSEDEAARILDFLGLPWDDSVLNHHRLHDGQSVGRTDNTRAIDTNSLTLWTQTLSEDDLAIIHGVCNTAANPLGYDLA